ncbi:histidine kinase [Chitinophaga pinensis]|uniref:histidine kinase n=1 Tax=Chitinophaga pinensis TaxID=79329 RepID=UPI001C996553|nr:histidine kinase [Chitinophaga pinensis]
MVDPFFQSVSDDPANDFKWRIARGAFVERLFQPAEIASAFVGSNSVVWIGVSIKFIKMWYEKRDAATQAELNFLKSQIHPHFLFNTLNNLYALSLTQSAQTPDVILGLSKILRYMLYECNTAFVSLGKILKFSTVILLWKRSDTKKGWS